MKQRRLINLISFILLGVVALLVFIRFLGNRLFGWSESVCDIFFNMSFYILMSGIFLSGLNYTIAKRNTLFSLLILIFLIVCIVFSALMV